MSIKERIERGAALLDEKIPEWESRLDLAFLHMASGCQCVLGQADEGDFWLALRKLFPYVQNESDLWQLAFEYGFNIQPHGDRYGLTEEDERYYASLTAEWKKFITERRKQHAS